MVAGTQTPAVTTSALNAESLPSPQIIFMTFFVDDSLVFNSNIVASLKTAFLAIGWTFVFVFRCHLKFRCLN